MADDHEPSPPSPTPRARRFFYGAVGLFLLWVAALIALAVVSGYHPMERAGAVPTELAPDHERADEGE